MPFSHTAALYAAVLFLSSTGLFSKLIPLDALTITQLRCAIAAGVFVVFSLFFPRLWSLPSLRVAGLTLACGLLMGVHWVTYFHSMQVSTVAVGMLALFSYPLVVVLLEPFFHRKALSKKDIVAALVVLVGVAILVMPSFTGGTGSQDGHSQVSDVQTQWGWGVFWGVVSALAFALRNLFQKYYLSALPARSIMAYQVVVVAIMLAPFATFSAAMSMSVDGAVFLVLLAIGPTILGHTLLSWCLQHQSVKRVAIVGCMQPVVGALLAWWVLAEAMTIYVAVGGALIIGVAVYESLARH